MSKAKEFPREVASRQQKGWQLRSRTPQTTPRAGDCKQAQSERQMGADQSGKGQVIECVSSKDSGFYLREMGFSDIRGFLSRGVAPLACVLTGSLWFLCGE